jgi:DNA polymerase-3 subunit epsilon
MLEELLDRSFREAPIAVVDVETTGLSSRGGDRVVELGIVLGRGRTLERSVGTLVDPERPIPAGARRVHGISDAMVRGKPRFPKLAARLAAVLEGRLFVAHNARFDLGFVDAELARSGVNRPAAPVLDTLGLCRRCFRFPSNGLGVVARALCLENPSAHRAQGDAETTWYVLQQLAGALEEQGARTVRDLVAASRRGLAASVAGATRPPLPPPRVSRSAGGVIGRAGP